MVLDVGFATNLCSHFTLLFKFESLLYAEEQRGFIFTKKKNKKMK